MPNLWWNSRKTLRSRAAGSSEPSSGLVRRHAGFPLTFRERFQMSWELTWLLALLDAAVVVLIHGVIDARGEALDSIWAVVDFFIASPWIVRRALARRYGVWNIVVRRRGEEHPRLNYQESLKVMWLLSWRILPLALLAALAISVILRLLRIPTSVIDPQDPLANALGLSVVFSLASLVLTPLLIYGMLQKHYRGFRLELKESVPPRYASGKERSKKPPKK